MGMHGSRYQDLDPSTLDTLTIRMCSMSKSSRAVVLDLDDITCKLL